MTLRHVRRFSYAPPKGAGGSDNASFFSLLGIAGVVGGAAYVYYDPDVLPEGLKRFLPIQEPKGHGMSLEEYEQWRAQQAGYPTALSSDKKEAAVVVESSSSDSDAAAKSEEEFLGPRRPIATESKASLEKLLVEARENEAAYLAELKKTRAPLTEEDRLLVRLHSATFTPFLLLKAFKDEKAKLKKQIKVLDVKK